MIELTIEEIKQRIIDQMEVVDFLDILGIGDISHLVEYFQSDIEDKYTEFNDYFTEDLVTIYE